MMQLKNFNNIRKIFFAGIAVLYVFIHVYSALAAADITASVASAAKNSVVLNLKNTGPAGIDANGSYLSIVQISVIAKNTTTQKIDSSIDGPILSGGETKTMTVAGLSPNTSYTIEVIAQENSTRKTVQLTAKTKTDPVQNQPAQTLPLSISRTAITTTTTEIRQISIKNTSTKDFTAVVTLQDALGSTIGSQSRLIAAGQTNDTISFSTLTPGKGYTLLLSGNEQGSNRLYTTTTYNGIVTKNLPIGSSSGTASTSATTSKAQATGADQCHDGIDNQIGDGKNYGYGINNGDHKADHYGVDTIVANGKGDGVIDIEPDPSCFSESATQETGDDVVSKIIPCTDKCSTSDVFRLMNNIITFFFKDLLIPIFVIILMYAGYQYLTAEGNPSKKANLKKMLGNIVKGIVLILCAWLIVRTIMTTLLNDNFKQSGVELLGN